MKRQRRTDVSCTQASPTDRIWGVGYDAAKAEANRSDWGQNLLGNALMRVRNRLLADREGANGRDEPPSTMSAAEKSS